jgi:hypothetical protein
MSAITETEPGGEMVCIVSFSARPRDSENKPLSCPRRDFRVGEHVRFVASFFKDSPADNPTGYVAVFQPLSEEDKGQYVATESYFVSLDCWNALERHFLDKSSNKNGGGARVKASRPHRPGARRTGA